MSGRIYVELYLEFLRTKIQVLGLADSEKNLSCISIINLLKIMMSLVLVACLDSKGQLEEFMKKSTIHCFTKNDSSGTCGVREKDSAHTDLHRRAAYSICESWFLIHYDVYHDLFVCS